MIRQNDERTVAVRTFLHFCIHLRLTSPIMIILPSAYLPYLSLPVCVSNSLSPNSVARIFFFIFPFLLPLLVAHIPPFFGRLIFCVRKSIAICWSMQSFIVLLHMINVTIADLHVQQRKCRSPFEATQFANPRDEQLYSFVIIRICIHIVCHHSSARSRGLGPSESAYYVFT